MKSGSSVSTSRLEKSQLPPKTKEELAKIRSEMMKKRPLRNIPMSTTNLQRASATDLCSNQGSTFPTEPQAPADVKSSNLMSRLAKGEKVQIDRKSMRRLTIKNYEKLPEIIQKKEAEKKLADLMTQKAK